jgi:8-oxo-dGTP diphosphatase
VEFRFCPLCGTALEGEYNNRTSYPTCPTGHYTYFPSQVVGVAGLITDGQRVLMERRAIEPGRGLWALPGGMAEPGESTEECLTREILEETGLIVAVGSLLGVRGGQRVCTVFHEATITGGVLTKSEESEELRWVSVGEIPWQEIAFPRHREILREWSDSADAR